MQGASRIGYPCIYSVPSTLIVLSFLSAFHLIARYVVLDMTICVPVTSFDYALTLWRCGWRVVPEHALYNTSLCCFVSLESQLCMSHNTRTLKQLCATLHNNDTKSSGLGGGACALPKALAPRQFSDVEDTWRPGFLHVYYTDNRADVIFSRFTIAWILDSDRPYVMLKPPCLRSKASCDTAHRRPASGGNTFTSINDVFNYDRGCFQVYRRANTIHC